MHEYGLFMKTNNVFQTHRNCLLFVSIPCGVVSSFGFIYMMIEGNGGPLPIWFITIVVLMCFSAGLLVAETGWRLFQLIDREK